MNQAAIYLNHLGVICAAGANGRELADNVSRGNSHCLSQTDEYGLASPLYLGKVTSPLPSLATFSSDQQTRCNQLLLAAFEQIKTAFTEARQSIAAHRIAIVIGTSTSGIAEGQTAVSQYFTHGQLPEGYRYEQQEMAAPAEFLAQLLAIKGPALVISTACSSSAKALASARRLLRSGVCDLVIAGGVDSLCGLTVHGFQALDSVSPQPCLPFSANRAGINIGEGAALFMMSKTPSAIKLSGVGECSDAHHISAPQPEGLGAEQAMQLALIDAGLKPADIGYINLHGTATVQNDKMESHAVARLFGCDTACSSSKSYTGHTLGAAGAIEAAICWLSLQHAPSRLPIHHWDGQRDPELAPLQLVTAEQSPSKTLSAVMSNSFAFGGNNISLVLEKDA